MARRTKLESEKRAAMLRGLNNIISETHRIQAYNRYGSIAWDAADNIRALAADCLGANLGFVTDDSGHGVTLTD